MDNQPLRIFLHCAATADYPLDKPLPYDYGVVDITAWHQAQGWKTCGYHRVIKRGGLIERGRPDSEIGAHVHDMNTGSIGICYVGTKRPTLPQLQSILDLYKEYKTLYGIDYRNWLGHYEVNPAKECPGVSMDVWRQALMMYDKLLNLGWTGV